MLAHALGTLRKDVVISTKVGFRTGDALVHTGLSRHHILGSAEESLRRLATDSIDLYLVHRVDPYTPIEENSRGPQRPRPAGEGSLHRLLQLAGVTRRTGTWPAAPARLGAVQCGRGLLVTGGPRCRTRDCSSRARGWDWSAHLDPLASGFLTGKYTRENPQGDGGRLTGFDILPYDRERGYALLDLMRTKASAHGATPAQVAIAWLLTRPAVTSVFLGVSKLSRLEDNLAETNLTLTADEFRTLDN